MGALDDLLKQKSGGSKPAPKSTPAPAKPAGGGSALDALLGTTAAPAAAAKGKDKKKSGGLFGALGQVRDMVVGAGPGLVRLGGGLLKEMAPDNPLTAKALPASERGWQAVERKMPLTSQILESTARTGRQIPDTAVALLPGGATFGQSNLGRQIRDEGYLSTGLAKVGDVALLAGGAGLALRGATTGGRLVGQASQLERLAKLSAQAAKVPADEFSLAKAAQAADRAGDATRALDLARAADQAAKASRLRGVVAGASKGQRVAGKATDVLGKVARGGDRASALPFVPTTKALGLAGKRLGAAARSERLAPIVAKAEAAVSRLRERQDVGDLYSESVKAPFEAEMHNVFERYGLENLARTLSREEQAAIYLTKSAEAADPAIRQLVDAVEELPAEVRPDVVARLFPDGSVTPEQLSLARAFRDEALPAEQQARLQAAADALSEVQRGREAAYVAGRGTSRKLSEAALQARAQRAAGQSADLDLASATERKQAPILARMDRIRDEAAGLEGTAPEPVPFSRAQERQMSRDAERTRRAAATVKGETARGERLLRTAGKDVERTQTRAANRTGQVIGRAKDRLEEASQLETGLAARKRQGREVERQAAAVTQAQKKLADAQSAERARRDRFERENQVRADRAVEKRLAALDAQHAKALDALDKAAREAADSVEAAPPQDRPALRVAQRAQALALELALAHPERAAEFKALADDIATTKSQLDAKGIRTEYFFGGAELDKVATPPPTAKLRNAKKLQSERVRTEGTLARSIKAQGEKYARETLDMLHNEFRGRLQDRMGSTVADELGITTKKPSPGPTGEELARQLDEAQLVAWDPGTGKLLDPADVTRDSAVLPAGLYEQVKKYTAAREPGLLLKVYDKATGGWKHTVLALSPRWHVGNIVGNAALATLGAGLTPAQIAKNVGEARRLVKAMDGGGDVPAQHEAALRRLIASGFHNPDLAKVEGRTKLGRLINRSYRFNGYVDNVNRTMVYLAKNKSGVSAEAAVGMALKASGDFSKMTPFERNVVRRVVPFYAWQRHITRLALSLPIEHPTRVAWTLHLADVASREMPDEGAENEFNEGTIPLFGKRLNVRNLYPITSGFFMDPTFRGAGYQLNPVLKAGVAATTGLNIGKELKPISSKENQGGFGQGPTLMAAKDPKGLVSHLGQQLPPVSLARDLIAGEVPVRYDTGQPRKVGKGATKKNAKPTLTGRKRGETVARFLGVPIPEREQKPKS